MRTIALYPGRWQPWHLGHKASYYYLVSKYGAENVYITSTNIVDDKSPFDFNERKAMIVSTGIPGDRVLLVKQQYNLKAVSPLISGFNMDTDKILFAISRKDMLGDPRFNNFTLKSGEPAYLQPMPLDFAKVQPAGKHGYLIVVPTKMFSVLGQSVKSASGLRGMFKKLNPEQKKQFITELFGKFDQNILNIFNNKLGSPKLKEIVDQILKEDDKWYDYRILGIAPEVPQGHEFRSKIPNLEDHPELWVDECPYSIRHIQDVSVEPEDKNESLREEDLPHAKDAQRANVAAATSIVRAKKIIGRDKQDVYKKSKDNFLRTKGDGTDEEEVDKAEVEMKKAEEDDKVSKLGIRAAQDRERLSKASKTGETM